MISIVNLVGVSNSTSVTFEGPNDLAGSAFELAKADDYLCLSLPAETDHLDGVKHVIVVSVCVTTLLHLVISQGAYRTDFCPGTPSTHSLLECFPKSPLKLVELVIFWLNLVYRSSTSQSYVPDAKYHLPKFGRQKVKFQSCSLDFYYSLSLHTCLAFKIAHFLKE